MVIYFLFSHLKELSRLYIYTKLLSFFSYLAYFYKYFDRKEWNVPPSSIFVDFSRQPLIIFHSKLYSVCPSDQRIMHSKPLKHLPINIWSATNTFIWLIPVVTSPKLPLRDQKFIQDGGHLITWSENISRTKQDMKKSVKEVNI
jgi:hypothetical protein